MTHANVGPLPFFLGEIVPLDSTAEGGRDQRVVRMALNPQLCPDGMPVPFVNEKFVLKRGGLEFEVDKIPE